MTFTILPDTHPALHERVAEFQFGETQVEPIHGGNVPALLERMYETMRANNAIGLAANQCGLPYRVFVMDVAGIKLAAFNPTIEAPGLERTLMPEGCLTFPGLSLQIKRQANIALHYQDERGEQQSINLGAWPARCALHETDHLNGIVFTSLVSKLKLDMARKKMFK